MSSRLQIVGQAEAGPNGAHPESSREPNLSPEIAVSFSEAQMKRLRGLFENNSTIQAIFEHAAQRGRNQTVTRLDRLLTLLQADGYDLDRPHLLEAFGLLEQTGAGELSTGRGAERARFIWHIDMRRLGRKLTGGGRPPVIAKVRRGQGPTLLTHTFYLRSDVQVLFKLPRDLTLDDVGRLGAYLKTLPLPNES